MMPSNLRQYALAPLAALFVGLSILSLWSMPARAQDFSAKPIRIIVSAAAGGATDAIARLVGQKIAPLLRTNVVVENRTGGHFAPAFREVVGAPADGHTLFMSPTSAVIANLLHPEIGYDMLRDFSPVTMVATGPLVLVARKDIPIKSVADLIAYDKQNPGKVVFGSGGGTGSSFYLALELLRLNTGITYVHVPYRGAGPALNDLLGGHIDMMFDAMPIMAPQISAGKVTPVAVTSARRNPALPAIPTVIEQGIPNYEVAGWFGLLAPANTPIAARRPLREAVATILKDPDVVKQLANQGMEPIGNEPDAWWAYLTSEFARWGKVIKDANIKAE
jgi:tripartite-type tricarboxylate transporter receptor subunit TctC